jgi:hypothetical protein
MTNKELLDHFTGIKLLYEKDRYGNRRIVGFSVCGEVYDMNDYGSFLYCAAFLGVAAVRIKQEKKVKVSVLMVMELRDYLLAMDKSTGTSYHEIFMLCSQLIQKAFELLGSDVEVIYGEGKFTLGDKITAIAGAVGDQNLNGHVTFDIMDREPEWFFSCMSHGMQYGNHY